MDVGNALLTIRDQGLYREFKTFDDYCKAKWGMAKSYAHYLVSGSQVAANLVLPRGNLYTPCEIQPIHEKQVRPLRVLEPAQQRTVWDEAVKTAPRLPCAMPYMEGMLCPVPAALLLLCLPAPSALGAAPLRSCPLPTPQEGHCQPQPRNPKAEWDSGYPLSICACPGHHLKNLVSTFFCILENPGKKDPPMM